MSERTVVVVTDAEDRQVIAVVEQGPQGPPGESTDPSLYFQVVNRFYEIAEDEIAKATARTNLGVAIVDCGTFN